MIEDSRDITFNFPLVLLKVYSQEESQTVTVDRVFISAGLWIHESNAA
jgi:hypothetical protein